MNFTISLSICVALFILLIIFWLQLKRWLAYKEAMDQYLTDLNQHIVDNCECRVPGPSSPPVAPPWPSSS